MFLICKEIVTQAVVLRIYIFEDSTQAHVIFVLFFQTFFWRSYIISFKSVFFPSTELKPIGIYGTLSIHPLKSLKYIEHSYG